MKSRTLLAGTALMLASWGATAAGVLTCDSDCYFYYDPVNPIETTTTVYNLAGNAAIYDSSGDSSSFPPFSATGTLTYNTWYDTDTGESGEDVLIEVDALTWDGSVFVDSYLFATGSTGLVTDYVYEEFDPNGATLTMLFDSTAPSQWNYLISPFDPVSAYTLDNNFDGIPGVRAYIFGEMEGAIDYQLSQVPLPATILLFGSGLLGLAGMARRKKT